MIDSFLGGISQNGGSKSGFAGHSSRWVSVPPQSGQRSGVFSVVSPGRVEGPENTEHGCNTDDFAGESPCSSVLPCCSVYPYPRLSTTLDTRPSSISCSIAGSK